MLNKEGSKTQNLIIIYNSTKYFWWTYVCCEVVHGQPFDVRDFLSVWQRECDVHAIVRGQHIRPGNIMVG